MTDTPNADTPTALPTSSASLVLDPSPAVRYVLRIADTCLILAQRLGEWCGHAPVLEEDIAMANIALDLLGQARALLAHAGTLDGRGHDEDRLAFLRDERDYLNVTLVELPNGTGGRRDFAFTVLRVFVVATFLKHLWTRLASSSDPALAAIASKAVKESRYHQQHAGEWVVRLGDGTDTSKRRIEDAVARSWRYTAELFESDAVDDAADASGLGPRWSSLRDAWLADVTDAFDGREARAAAAAGGDRLPQHRQVGPAQRAHGLPARRDAVAAARLSGRRVVTDVDASAMASSATDRAADMAAHPVGDRAARAWAVLGDVLDPEVPALSIVDLGIVRDVVERDDGTLALVLTPTYSGCPATEAIEAASRAAIEAAGLGPIRVETAARAGVVERLDQRRRPTQARRLRHRAAGPLRVPGRAAAPLRPRVAALPALRQPAHRAAVRVRVDRVQVAASLPRVPRAVRALQADLSDAAVPSAARPRDRGRHAGGGDRLVRRARRTCARRSASRRASTSRCARRSTASTCAARIRSAPASTTASCASASARCARASSRTGSTRR